jgi:FMN phosphatase YigB (HAD superfamily)
MPVSLSLFTEQKKLRVLDFDDTLVRTNSKIYVTNSISGKSFILSPGQYAVYKKKTGDVFDYKDFSDVVEPEQIKYTTQLLHKMAKGSGDRMTVILTARAKFEPVKEYLKDIGIRNVKVIALGDSNPEKKADWIEDMVKNKGFDDVFFIDDSHENVKAVENRLKSLNIKYKIQHFK